MNHFQQIYQKKKDLIEERIASHLKHSPLMQDIPHRLGEAMSYCLLSGGKRVRSVLVLLVHDLVKHLIKSSKQTISSESELEILDIALSVEMIHTYSLIHDDLPAMDDDALRRGKPSCHIQFDEATAILTGDAWLNQAFELLANLKTTHLGQVISLIAGASGARGMAGGQMIDIWATGNPVSQQELEHLHRLKTGRLIQACALAPVVYYDCHSIRQTLKIYGEKIGLAFQVMDDFLEVTQSSEVLGKNTNSDASNNKFTFVHLLGIEAAEKYAKKLIEEAIQSISTLVLDGEEEKRNLECFARYLTERTY